MPRARSSASGTPRPGSGTVRGGTQAKQTLQGNPRDLGCEIPGVLLLPAPEQARGDGACTVQAVVLGDAVKMKMAMGWTRYGAGDRRRTKRFARWASAWFFASMAPKPLWTVRKRQDGKE